MKMSFSELGPNSTNQYSYSFIFQEPNIFSIRYSMNFQNPNIFGIRSNLTIHSNTDIEVIILVIVIHIVQKKGKAKDINVKKVRSEGTF